jgi:hypothetical protein
MGKFFDMSSRIVLIDFVCELVGLKGNASIKSFTAFSFGFI